MVQRSIARSLSFALFIVGVIGLAVLMAAIMLDYHITFGGLGDPLAFKRAWHELEAHVLLPALVITLPMALVSWRIVRRSLLPIEGAAQAIIASSEAQPGVRVDTRGFPLEIVPLAEGVNGLLERLEALAERNAAFAADVAHELRTPLTLLGLELERLDFPQAGRLRGQVREMQKLVGQLLMIARIDSPELRLDSDHPVDLAEVGAAVVAQMAPAILSSGLVLEFDNLGTSPIIGQSEAIAAALRNLVDNAERATPRGGVVTVIAGPGPALGVADGGSGLSEADLARLSQRNVRADHASHDGAGLGLAIVAKIMMLHQGQLNTDTEMRRITMRFPQIAAPATAASD